MKYKSFIKDFWRTIKNSKGRFLAIFCMVALGAGVFSGLNESSIDMKRTADVYYDDSNFMDIRLLSTYGFTEEDINVISELDYIDGIMPGYSVDAIIELNDSDYVVRVHSIPLSPSDDCNYINRPVLVEGRMPSNEDECLLSTNKAESNKIKVGDTITLSNDATLDGNLENRDYTVAGIVNSSAYIAFVYGNSSIGNGSLTYFMYVPESNFQTEYYTDVYARVTDAESLNCFYDEYDKLIDNAADKLEILSEERISIRYNDIVSSATDAIKEAKKEYNNAEIEVNEKLSDAYISLTDAELQLSEKEQELIDAEKDIEQAEKELDSAEKDIEQAEKELDSGKKEYEKALASYNAGYSEYEDSCKLLEQKKLEYESAYALYESGLNDYNNAIANGIPPEALSDTYEALCAMKVQLDAAYNEIVFYTEQLASTKIILDAYKTQLETSKKELDSAEKIISDGKREIRKGRQELAEAKDEINDGKIKIEEAKTELSDAYDEYNNKKIEAEEELANAKKEIDEAEKELAELEKPQWYILDRNTNSGFVSFASDSDRMKSLATVFPLIFFLVAALVALTTMTRMVDEERSIIGTYKALGYSNSRIMGRYILYALLASLSGSITGILVLSRLLSNVTWTAYRMLYIAPDVITRYDPKLVIISTSAATFCTLFATYFACRNSLAEHPSSLLLPRAPKPGKRILLEKIGFIWNRLSFNNKVTARNIFRYKKRMLMTVIGIAGCTALVLTGFGLKDSVSGIVSNQFDDIYNYNVQITTEGELSDDALDIINNKEYFSSHINISQRGTDMTSDSSTVTGYIIIPAEANRLSQFINIRNRTTRKTVEFNSNSVVISEKAADKLGLSVGESITVKSEDDRFISFTITGITENYIYNYLYIAPEIYKEVSGEDPEMNSVLLIGEKFDKESRKTISDQLLTCKNIGSVAFMDDYSTTFNGMVETLNIITVVLIVLAATLAFVVLYNLTNINITERRKELATIKVLGFFDREVSAYIFRETIILTIIGCMLGLVLGVFMQRLVISTIEVDMVMFGRQISVLSFVISAALTILFSVITELIMKPKMNSIDMVESLKSVD